MALAQSEFCVQTNSEQFLDFLSIRSSTSELRGKRDCAKSNLWLDEITWMVESEITVRITVTTIIGTMHAIARKAKQP